jgi:hypothetical protein
MADPRACRNESSGRAGQCFLPVSSHKPLPTILRGDLGWSLPPPVKTAAAMVTGEVAEGDCAQASGPRSVKNCAERFEWIEVGGYCLSLDSKLAVFA